MDMNVNTNMGTTVYWYKNQAAIMYQALVTPANVATKVTAFRNHLNQTVLDVLDYTLVPLMAGSSPQPNTVRATNESDNLDGVYLFDSPKNTVIRGDPYNTVVVFYHIVPKSGKMSDTMADSGSMRGNGGVKGMGTDDATDHTVAVVNELNNHTKALQTLGVSTFNALPHWFNVGTPDITQGCPISPPFPVPVEKSGNSGRWKIQFPQLPETLNNATGKDVAVLVLDTLPAPGQISRALEQAGPGNMLLKELTSGMKWEEPLNAAPPAINCKSQFLPDVMVDTTSERVVTGKDIYGRHVGFPMADHGLFVAGILRDLAPEAHIECIRVLNDFGIGDIRTLCAALQEIHKRMSFPDSQEAVNLYKKPVVINLSLVVFPPEDDIPAEVTAATLKASRDALNSLLQSLADLGAIFVAAAGNDSDPRMNASENRFGPRYPAALAYDDHAMTAMISVGAVNRNRAPALYSNYPGSNGIATYGGDLPKPDPWLPSAMSHVATHIDMTYSIDALCGLYTAPQYPALSRNDPESEYATPNSKGWAYWSGTSFATPIISALAARVLQGHDSNSIDVRQAILNAAMDEVMWTGVGIENSSEDIPGPLIMAVQEWQNQNTPSS
ncbi:MAG: hypothetical protein NVS4B7_15100 [Ktedonobacteraceae bacterium]